MKRDLIYKKIMLAIMLACSMACRDDMLEIKPDQHLVVPKTLEDFQALMNNAGVLNLGPGMQILASDELEILTAADLAGFGSPAERNSYLWKPDLYEGTNFMPDWDKAYQVVFYCNVVLSGLENIERKSDNAENYDQIKGSALFFRSLAFYQLVSEFADVYEQATANSKLGIPLKLSADVNEKLKRATLKESYEQITNDLAVARNLLAKQRSINLVTPSKHAVDALSARIYLSMGNYAEALKHVNSCIAVKPELIDFNTLNISAARPISAELADQKEVIFLQIMHSYIFASRPTTYVAKELVDSYHKDDLRKFVFFNDRSNGYFVFKGSYSGSATFFIGLAMDEMYLIRAECKVRTGDIVGGLEDVGFLLRHRWNKNADLPVLHAPNQESALKLIFEQRRLELLTRGTRWSDLKRLNLDDRFAVGLKRNFVGETYELIPRDRRYIFPIPDSEIKAHGLIQNER